MIRRKRRPKYNEAREVPKPKVIKWEIIGEDDYKAIVGEYTLRAEEMTINNWFWAVYKNRVEIAHSSVYGNKTTLQKAKNAAVFQMTKHKKYLIRKIVNT